MMAQQSTTFQQPASSEPTLHKRPPRSETSGRIQLDVVVTDSAGHRVTGLQSKDFTLFDNQRPQKILTFQAFDCTTEAGARPAEVILLIDTVNLPFTEVATMRQETEKFLRQNGGHLADPVSIMVFSDKGLTLLAEGSTDGNALALEMEKQFALRTITNASDYGELERFQLSLKVLAHIADRESIRQGRKLLIWIGPGWPLLERMNWNASPKNLQEFFDFLVFLSTRLREARTALYTVADARDFQYRKYLKGVTSAQKVDGPNQSLEALALRSGGRILGPDNDIVKQINECVQDADSFYRISFDPPKAEHANEFHQLEVRVDRPGDTARTNTWYYDQPN
jgi:VWFA-related protein